MAVLFHSVVRTAQTVDIFRRKFLLHAVNSASPSVAKTHTFYILSYSIGYVNTFLLCRWGKSMNFVACFCCIFTNQENSKR